MYSHKYICTYVHMNVCMYYKASLTGAGWGSHPLNKILSPPCSFKGFIDFSTKIKCLWALPSTVPHQHMLQSECSPRTTATQWQKSTNNGPTSQDTQHVKTATKPMKSHTHMAEMQRWNEFSRICTHRHPIITARERLLSLVTRGLLALEVLTYVLSSQR
jgi:hypothetical protein